MERMIAGAVVALGLTFGLPWIGSAQAAPVVGCEHREPGHVGKHGGQLVDDAYHRSRGESITCEESPNGDRTSDENRSTSTGDDNQDRGKTRYCRRHLWC